MPRRRIHLRAPAGLWPMTWPMGLTMLRLLLLPVFLWLILAGAEEGHSGFRWAAIAIFAVMAATDKLDGYLARRLNQISRLGTILDPLADKLLVACSLILLSFPAIATPRFRIPLPVVATVYAGYLLVAGGSLVVLAIAGTVSINPRPLGKLGTALQLGLVLLTLVAPNLRANQAVAAGKILRVGWWVVPIVAALTCADYLVQGVLQLRAARTREKRRSESGTTFPGV